MIRNHTDLRARELFVTSFSHVSFPQTTKSDYLPRYRKVVPLSKPIDTLLEFLVRLPPEGRPGERERERPLNTSCDSGSDSDSFSDSDHGSGYAFGRR